MKNTTQFQTTPGYGNLTINAGKGSQTHWGETTGYGYNWEGIVSHGTGNGFGNHSNNPSFQGFLGTVGFGTPTLGFSSTGQEIYSTVFQGQSLVQSLFSENGLVLGPIYGGADSFFGTSSESGQISGISRFINLVQGVNAAQIIAYTGFTGGQSNADNATIQGQGFGASSLTSLINVRYHDNNSSFVIEAAIVGGNQKNLSVNVVGDEIRIQKTEWTSTGKNTATSSSQGNTGTFYSLPLPHSANSKGITATAKDGILTITLPKMAEISKNTRQITVK